MKGSIIAVLLALVAADVRAAAPAPYDVTPDLVAAATQEAKVVWYTSLDVAVAESIARAFETTYPGIAVSVEHAGAERLFQRIHQEYGSAIHADDVLETADDMNFLALKREGWLEPALPADVAHLWPDKAKDPDGLFAAVRAHLNVIGYNTKLVKPDDAPKSWRDLLGSRWRGRMVKAHPGYSGAIMTATFALAQALGWDYFEKLGGQRVLQVQSATEPPKKLAMGERAVMADGSEYVMFRLKESGAPVEIVYAAEGTPIIIGNAAVMKAPPHPAAAKLFYAFLYSAKAQQMMSDIGGLRSFRPDIAEKAGRKPLSDIKLLFSDPAAVEAAVPDIRARYELYFGT